MVLKHQNPDEKGYYTYQQWKELHAVLFDTYPQDPVINAWRILKLINFGDDFVPTGLVFDTLVTLIKVNSTTE